MNSRRIAFAAVLAAGALALVVLFVVIGGEDDQTGAGQPGSEQDPVLLAADEHGALVLVGDEVLGVGRDGEVVWRRKVAQPPLSAICEGACPRAVLSGDGLGPLAVDAAPVLEGGAQLPDGWDQAVEGKNQVVVADRAGAVRVVTDPSGQAWWEMTRPTGQVHREKAAGANVFWFPSADGTAAVAMLLDTDSSRYVQQPLVRRSDGWHTLAPPAVNSEGASGCISSHGRRWMVDGKTVETAGGPHPLAVEGTFGNCAFTSRSLVMSGNSKTDGSAQTAVVVVDDGGRRVAGRTLEAEFFLVASNASDEFVLMGDGSGVATLYDRNAEAVRTIDDASFAAYTPTGSLVVVAPDGRVRWLEH